MIAVDKVQRHALSAKMQRTPAAAFKAKAFLLGAGMALGFHLHQIVAYPKLKQITQNKNSIGRAGF
jgi:hypothetical protein